MPRLFDYLMNKPPQQEAMRPPERTTISARHIGPVDDAAPSPAALEDLADAWAELKVTAKESGVLNFHACSRTGERWQDDPESVRFVAAQLRESSAL